MNCATFYSNHVKASKFILLESWKMKMNYETVYSNHAKASKLILLE